MKQEASTPLEGVSYYQIDRAIEHNRSLKKYFFYYNIKKEDNQMTGDRNIKMGSGNYNERIEGDYFEQKGNFGVGVNKKLAGSINEAQSQNLPQAAAEIQELLEQLDKSYDTGTTSGKEKVTSETIKKIENNPELKARIISALKAGGISALESLIDHPVATFVVAALEDWRNKSN